MRLDSDPARIRHMVDAAEEALEYAKGRTRADVDDDPPLRHLLIGNLIILGEAASRVSLALRAKHSDVPWKDMVATRNRLIHAYFDINYNIVWYTVSEILPGLVVQLREIRDGIEGE